VNIFTTDHPMMSEPSPAFLRLQRRLWKGFLILAIGYPVYLILLGSLYSLNGHGVFNFLPQPMREAFMLPAAPVYVVPGLRSSYDDYLNWWYVDPNAADRETGWQ
jgi:hypothetical protein